MPKRKREELEARVAALEVTIDCMVRDRGTFIRHQQTLGRHMRRVLADNKQLRTDKNTLMRYVKSVSQMQR